jgi:ribosome-binding factor A
MSLRTERVSALIQKEVSEIIIREVKDPRFQFITITAVEVSSDLRNATIFYSTVGNSQRLKDCSEALSKASGFIRHRLSQRLYIKFIPRIEFRYDSSMESGQRIEAILDRLTERADEN